MKSLFILTLLSLSACGYEVAPKADVPADTTTSEAAKPDEQAAEPEATPEETVKCDNTIPLGESIPGCVCHPEKIVFSTDPGYDTEGDNGFAGCTIDDLAAEDQRREDAALVAAKEKAAKEAAAAKVVAARQSLLKNTIEAIKVGDTLATMIPEVKTLILDSECKDSTPPGPLVRTCKIKDPDGEDDYSVVFDHLGVVTEIKSPAA